ncbi:MAG: FprA family A-type flavoprotein [Muribaculaceae bacterium]|nr:FprA family A-type flavoprotein [Muribaculaceae bacterium]
MNTQEIVKNIFYVGVNDRTTHIFESLWSLPYGVSYNSYLIRDGKNVLIDTVESGQTYDFMDKLSSILESEPIHYLVINHMEPDHSGSIPAIVAKYPDIKIIGNKQTIGMIKGFYHINDDKLFYEVKDGDVLELGTRHLSFHLTPMVHWPETMMCYIPEDKLLFSGDAFGTFGALNGTAIDTYTDTELYIREMYRYYACIVGKYGRFVQKALSALSDFPLEYICPTHGPVWNNEIEKVVDIVDTLSKGEGEDGVTIVYGSMYGNTQVLAEAIASELANLGIRKIRVHNAAKDDMSEIISDAFRYKGLIVGSPTYSMNLFPPVESLMQAMLTRDVKNKTFAAFGSYTWASAALKKLHEYADRLGWEVVSSIEMKQAPNEDHLFAAKELARKFKETLYDQTGI